MIISQLSIRNLKCFYVDSRAVMWITYTETSKVTLQHLSSFEISITIILGIQIFIKILCFMLAVPFGQKTIGSRQVHHMMYSLRKFHLLLQKWVNFLPMCTIFSISSLRGFASGFEGGSAKLTAIHRRGRLRDDVAKDSSLVIYTSLCWRFKLITEQPYR